MAKLLVARNLVKSFGPIKALKDCSLEIEQGSWLSLLGPSGSGKTTLLRILAGLEDPDEGRLSSFLPETPRGLLVYQDYLLFPTMRVWENASYGLVCRGIRKSEAKRQALELLSRLGIAEKAESWPHELSAGQQQRTALARALAMKPALLLLDEPFANLDPALRLETALVLKDLQKAFALTLVCVTHDREEAFLWGDEVALLCGGQVVAQGSPEDLTAKPMNLEAARLLGEINYPEGPGGPGVRDWDTVFHPGHGPDLVKDVRSLGIGWRVTVQSGDRLHQVRTLQSPPEPGTSGALEFRKILTARSK